MNSYNYFQNRECKYFPCHDSADPDNFSCLFCFCPLYALGDRCGGSFEYLSNGIKDCSRCLKPHKMENYDKICEKLGDVVEMVKKT